MVIQASMTFHGLLTAYNMFHWTQLNASTRDDLKDQKDLTYAQRSTNNWSCLDTVVNTTSETICKLVNEKKVPNPTQHMACGMLVVEDRCDVCIYTRPGLARPCVAPIYSQSQYV